MDPSMAERIKSRIEQLRKDGKNEEADNMQKRVKAMTEHMAAGNRDGQPKAKAPEQSREDAKKAFMSMAEGMKTHLVEELRKDGKNEEADRIDSMAKKFAENMAKHRSEQQAQSPGKDRKGPSPSAKGDQSSVGRGHHECPPLMGAANAKSRGGPQEHRGNGDQSPNCREHHRGYGGHHKHHRGHGGRGQDRNQKGRGFGHQGGMTPWASPGSWGNRRGQGQYQRGRGFGMRGGMAPWGSHSPWSFGQQRNKGGERQRGFEGRGFGMRGGMAPWGSRSPWSFGQQRNKGGECPSKGGERQSGPEGRGFGTQGGMMPWGAPPPFYFGQNNKKGDRDSKEKRPEQKGGPMGRGFGPTSGMSPKGGPPAWGGKMPHHQEGDNAPKGDKPKGDKAEGKKDGEKNHEHKGGRHHDENEDGPKEEIRPAGKAGSEVEGSVGEPPQD